jgi:hypothetical protein
MGTLFDRKSIEPWKSCDFQGSELLGVYKSFVPLAADFL